MRASECTLPLRRGRLLQAQCVMLIAISACVPSRREVFGPVDREIDRRLAADVDVTWTASSDARARPAIAELLRRPIDRDAAVKIALATNRRLQARFDELGISAAAIASATVLAPIDVDLNHKFATSSGGGGETEVDVIQDVVGLIQIAQRRGVARAELAAARARAVAATIDLVARVEMRYIDLLAAQQEVELRQTAFDAAAAAAEIVERMHSAGNAVGRTGPDLALARERDQREQARIELARAQLDAELRREEMNEILGLSGEQTRWTVNGRLPEIPPAVAGLDRLERDAVAASLDLVAIRSEADAAASRVGLARFRAWLPGLGVGVSAARREGGWEVGPAVRIGLPIFNQQQGPRARANAELRRTRNEAIATAVELRAQARGTRQRVLQAHAEARHILEVVLPLRQRVLDETLKQYNAMNATTFELLVARRDLVDGGHQYIDALRRFWNAAATARALTRGVMPSAGPTEERAELTRPTLPEED